MSPDILYNTDSTLLRGQISAKISHIFVSKNIDEGKLWENI